MALTITERALLETRKTRIEPQLVLEIEGVATLFGAVEISRLIRIGDPDLYIGNDWKIGGLVAVDDQESIISFGEGSGGGSSTRIEQQLQPDKGSVSSVSSVQVALVDKDLIATRLISPGIVIEDILGVKATLWMGFKNTAFKEDYVPIMSGIIDDIESGAGTVKLNIAHPEQLKRQDVYTPVAVVLSASIDNSQTTIGLDDASGLMVPQLGPDELTYDSAISFYVQIEDEIIEYTGVSGNNLTGCVRGSLATLAVAHTISGDPITGKSLVQIEDSAVYCALKIMLSGKNGPYIDAVPVSRYLHPTPLTTVANSVFFNNIDLNRDYGVSEGDYITITGATNGANNCTAAQIQTIEIVDGGSYAIINGVTFVEEPDTTAVCSFRSQFDTLGYGLGMTPDQVDVNEHIYWNDLRLAPYTYRFVLKDKISGKDFLDKEIYLPVGAYSLPRQGRCSMGFHIGPVARDRLLVLSRDNIKDPDKIKLRRTINRNFYNTIVYSYEEIALSGKFVRGAITYSADSQNRIRVGTRALNIVSKGLRTSNGATITAEVSSRYLSRYQFAAEFFEAVNLLFRDGYTIEPGDSILLDPAQLNISNTEEGNRDKAPKIFTVVNKSLDLKTGDVKVALTDAVFDNTENYGTISPSSNIVSGTTTSIIIEDSYGSIFPGNESRKWKDYLGLPVVVHSPDWTYEHEVILLSIDAGNKYQLHFDPSTPLPIAPLTGYVLDIPMYPVGTDANENGRYKAVHAFNSATVAIVDAADDTHFEVAIGDIGKFSVGGQVRIHNDVFTNDSGILTVISIVGTIVEVSASMGFTPVAGDVAENMDFADGGNAYLII